MASVLCGFYPRKLRFFYWQPPEGHTNFGDELSPVIVAWVSGRRLLPVPGNTTGKLMALGTLLEDWARDGDVVWGAGSRCIRPENIQGKRLDVRMVRGPLTRDYLRQNGLACPEVYGDPAILMPLIHPVVVKPPAQRAHDFGVASMVLDPPLAIPPGAAPIDVRAPWQTIIARLADCRTVISSSLHCLIVAEAYGIPAIWLRSARETSVKYYDYYLSTGRRVEPAESVAEAMAATPPPLPQPDREKMIAAFPRELKTLGRRA